MKDQRTLEINGGKVIKSDLIRLEIPTGESSYTNAQIDDYGGRKRRDYLWQKPPGVTLSLQARFSHSAGKLSGTAGFGFWNAPFGDPTTPWPTLPQATWFFLAAPPGDLPLNPDGLGQGLFASTLDATTWQALSMAPLAPPVILLNRWPPFKQKVWPKVQQRLGMSYQQLDQTDITNWHGYKLSWSQQGCTFWVDNKVILTTNQSPRGPLGFVCWIDNQYMQVTPTGRISTGSTETPYSQWLEIKQLNIRSFDLNHHTNLISPNN